MHCRLKRRYFSWAKEKSAGKIRRVKERERLLAGFSGVAARFAPAAVLVAAADLSGGRAGLDDRAMGFAGTGHTITFLSAEW